MKKTFLFVAMLALLGMITSCGAKKTANTGDAEVVAPQVAGTLTKTLADGSQVTWIRDNADERVMPRTLFDAPDELISELGLEGGMPASVSTYILKKGEDIVLFDAGLGVGGNGQLVNILDSLGIAPADIDYLYVTHFHGDHIGGMLNNGEVVFPNAQVYVGQVEYDAWMAMPEDRNAQVRETMAVYQANLHFFAFGDTLPNGVVAIDAVGHTPGHTVFQKDELLIIGDLMHGAALQMEHPEYNANFDQNKEDAAASRARIIQYAKDNNLLMAGMHLPEPGFWE